MSEFVVVDTSVAVKWLLEEDDSDKAIALLQHWHDEGILPYAPYLMLFEVANVLHRRVAQSELEVEAAANLMQGLLSVGVEFYHPTGLHTRALELASRLGQGAVYDSHYLALAQILGLRVLDGRPEVLPGRERGGAERSLDRGVCRARIGWRVATSAPLFLPRRTRSYAKGQG